MVGCSTASRRTADHDYPNNISLVARLLVQFSLCYEIRVYSPSGGRPRKLQHHHQVLGVLLAFYAGSTKRASLCLNFGILLSTLSWVLIDAEDAFSRALRGFPSSPNSVANRSSSTIPRTIGEVRQPLLSHLGISRREEL
ncbi:hypothetical protein GQ600_286 [Phytophthora cactorum]|nr:hypothetical protein GQ600_286 [Phytophthora cactorum]